MTEQKQCPECGSPVASSGPAGGLCPRCLMKRGLGGGGSTRTGLGGRGRFVPPEPEELAARFPKLEILELIGQGGMGAVYKARQPGLDRIVALKILAPDRVLDPAFAERFGREARTLARLAHPRIVGIHEFGQADDLYYFVMEYVDGASLREVIGTGRLSPVEALALVPQICEALQFAHDSGVVHRDVKPENILLDHDGNVKIADFGLAKMLEPGVGEGVSLTASGAAMGTAAYMAPEQIEHPLEVDHRADIYAVGVVFYEMLTGELPLGRFDPPSSKVTMDIRIDDVVLRALEKERARRYQLARDVQVDVESIGAEGEPASPGSGGRPVAADDATPSGGAVPGMRTIRITRPAGVTWVATYSLLVAALGVLIGFGACGLFAMRMLGASARTPGLPSLPAALGGTGEMSLPFLLMVTVLGGGLGLLLPLWHLVIGFGLLRMRNWARFNLIVLAVLEAPLSLLPFFEWAFIPFLPVAFGSAACLVYLLRPPVARAFELGLGPAVVREEEAAALERFTRAY